METEEEMDENNMHQNDSYQQSNAYQNGVYQQNNAYQNGNYQQNNTYQNNNYTNNNYSNDNNGYQQYQQYQPYGNVQQPYNDNGVELEEPVKMSEWALALAIMMVPCVNIIMMFVWAFSKSEKKSKSNFFKVYLIFFAIIYVLMLLLSIAMMYLVAYTFSLY